jgi:hypothetical protein
MKGVVIASALVAMLIAPSKSGATVISGAIATAGPLSGDAPQCNQSGPVSSSCSYLGNPQFHFVPLQSTSSSFADLATGNLQASAGTVGGGIGTARAELKDTISLILPSNYSSNNVNLTVSLNFNSVLLQGEAIAEDDILLGQFPGFFTSTDGFIGTGHNGAGNSLAISATLTLPLNDITNIPIDAFLTVTTGNNFGNGYANVDPDLGITLPEGATFTSGSGVLLSQVAAVPEPSSFTLLGAGLVAFGLYRRRQQGNVGQCKE